MESNLIRGHRSLTGQSVLKWVSEGPEWLWLPQKGCCNGTAKLTAGLPQCSQGEDAEEDVDMRYLNSVCATVSRKIKITMQICS